MNFSRFSIQNPIPAIMLFVLLTLAGIMSYRSTIVQDFPDIELPLVTVTANLPGAAPAQLETEVSRKIEDSVATLQGVKNIFTNVLDGVSYTTVEFVLEKPINEAVNEVRDAVSAVRADLPSEMRDPVVTKMATAGRVVLAFAVKDKNIKAGETLSNETLQEMSWYVDNQVSKSLKTVKGVGAVKRVGGANREIRVELDANKMAALGVSAVDISRRLRSVQRETPGGRGDVSGAEQAVRTIATIKTADELAALEIPLYDGRKVRLDEVATINDTVAEARSQAQYDGNVVVGFEILRTKGASEIEVADGVKQAVEKLNAQYPNYQIQLAIDNAAPIVDDFKGSMELLYEGALLAVIVVFWFLRDWRSTLVAATALPLSVIPTFLGIKYFGYTLNGVTLLSLALVVGVLVDDAIVEIENIARHLAMGKTPMEAATEAADEIGMAVIATTFALVAVFLPTAFMGGVPGLFFKQFGWTAVLAIIASLVVARLLTPMMCAYLLKPAKVDESGQVVQDAHGHASNGKVMQWYLGAAKWCIHNRWKTLCLAILFFIGSVSLVGFLPKGFVPSTDRGVTQVVIELPPGSTLNETRVIAEQAQQVIAKLKNIEHVFSSIGGGSTGDAFAMGAAAEARRAVLTIVTTHRSKRSEKLTDIDNVIREKMRDIPGARFMVGPQDVGVKYQLVLKSDDSDALLQEARKVERELRTLPGIGGVSSNASLVRPEIIVRPDFAKAADLGVTAESIGETVRVATAGDYDMALSKMNVSQRQIPIRVKLPNEVRADLDAMSRLTVWGKEGPVPLSSVASITMESGPAQVDRLNRSRNVMLEVELAGRELGEVEAEAMALPSLKNLPSNVTIAALGDAQEMGALFANFLLAMAIGILCIYGVLVLLFKDFLQPITLLFALPLSVGGAFVGLLVTNKALSMPSMIGMVMLMGIVTKNSILLVDYVIIARREGKSRFDALVDACHKRSRPIIMTTIAMGAGMMPLALGFGADPNFRSPMAVTVIGGLITSTLLSLLVVPAVFTLIDDLLQFLKRVFLNRRHKTSEV